MRYKIFISSVQSEFAGERRMLADYLRTDALFAKFFDTFIFEDTPAKDHSPENVYIDEVRKSDIFILLLGKDYGYEFEDGTSPIERELAEASKENKYRLVYLTNTEKTERHEKTQKLIDKISNGIIYNTFSTPSELLSDVYTSLINFLLEKGELRTEPFDKSANRDAELSDINDEKIEWFVRRARAERNFPLTIEDGTEKILTHLNLLNKGKITNAAVLLFGKQPQRFFITSEVKCAHFHGTRVEKPIPFYQTYKGNLFELVDQAVDFVLSKIDLAIGTRDKSVEVPTAYEIPKAVIQEAIVNAIAHRDYDSTASVQVMLFRDRLEVWNPGALPAQLSIDTIKQNHGSFPHNPLIADGLYYAHYIERMGTGIQDIVEKCLAYGLPEPAFFVRDGFVSVIYRKQDVAYNKVNDGSGQIGGQIGGQISGQISGAIGGAIGGAISGAMLTDRQQKIIEIVKINPKISRKEIAKQLNINESAVLKHLDNLKQKGFIERIGGTRGYWKITEK